MKRIFLLTIISACVLLLFGCSGEGNGVPSVSNPVTSETPDVSVTSPPTETPEVKETPQGQQDGGVEANVPVTATGEVVISFDYTRQSGSASNQHAIWVEDMDGRLIKSLFASRWTADGGFATRPDSIAMWAERTDLANMTSTEVDAVSGATPATGAQSYIWDLTDLSGEIVLQGDYVIFVEGTLRWKNFVLYSGVISIGSEPVVVQVAPVFHFEESDRYAALTADSVENNMIGPVTVEFIP